MYMKKSCHVDVILFGKCDVDLFCCTTFQLLVYLSVDSLLNRHFLALLNVKTLVNLSSYVNVYCFCVE